MAAKAIEGRAWDVVLALLSARAWRPKFEAARLVLAYSIGAPRQTVELTGGIGDLSRELAEALKQARARRASLDAGQPVAAIVGTTAALPAPPADATPTLEDALVTGDEEGAP